VVEYVGEIEVDPGEMGRVEWVFVDRVGDELDFHIHQANEEE
jgi:hypothetical protein